MRVTYVIVRAAALMQVELAKGAQCIQYQVIHGYGLRGL
jgi:hypothetical protein